MFHISPTFPLVTPDYRLLATSWRVFVVRSPHTMVWSWCTVCSCQ